MSIEVESKAKVSSQTGIDADKIGTVRLQLDKLLTEGILIQLDVKGESMFSRMAEWGEIGIEVGDIRSVRMTRGRKYLIADERIKNLRTVTTRMRQWLEKMTNDITGFRPYRYLFYKRYPEWKEKWEVLTGDFERAKQDILDNYEVDIESLKLDFQEIALNSWKSIRSCGYEEVTCDGFKFTDFESFSEHMVSSVIASVPTKSLIESTLKADYFVSILKGRDQIEAEAVKSEKHKAEIEIIKANEKAKVHEAFAQERLLTEDLRHKQEMNSLLEQEKNAQIDAMIQAEASHIREQFAETVAPIEEVFSQVRKEMAEICIDAIESIKKNGHVRGRTADKLHGLVEFYNMTSIQDDPKLLLKLQELKKVIGAVGGVTKKKEKAARTPEQVISALNDVVDLKNTIREDLAQVPSRFSFVE